jgi:hypothetical protein
MLTNLFIQEAEVLLERAQNEIHNSTYWYNEIENKLTNMNTSTNSNTNDNINTNLQFQVAYCWLLLLKKFAELFVKIISKKHITDDDKTNITNIVNTMNSTRYIYNSNNDNNENNNENNINSNDFYQIVKSGNVRVQKMFVDYFERFICNQIVDNNSNSNSNSNNSNSGK